MKLSPIAESILSNQTNDDGLPVVGQAISVLKPVFCILDQLDTGYVDSVQGRPVFKDWHGEWCEIYPALQAFADCFERIAKGEGIYLDLSNIRKLGNKLKYGTPFDTKDVKTARSLVNRCASIYLATPVRRLKNYIMSEQIAIEMQSIGITA